MQRFPVKLVKTLEKRKRNQLFRRLAEPGSSIDFCSNDYLGMARNPAIYKQAHDLLVEHDLVWNGATGSRLLTGNHSLYSRAEDEVKEFFEVEDALLYNSGFDANIGFFSSVPQRGDIIFYDEFSHASIRDGIRMSAAKAYRFKHNDLKELEDKLIRTKTSFDGEIFVVSETVFSMDGDMPDCQQLAVLAKKYDFYLVLDEAHAAGIIGPGGRGVVPATGIGDVVFARVVTFGKAMGAHGAAVLGGSMLKNYLVNFSRSLIYTTALAPHAVATVVVALEELSGNGRNEIEQLESNIRFFKSRLQALGLEEVFLPSNCAIHSCLFPGNGEVREAAQYILNAGFNVKPILSPTVPEGGERLRFCLHSFNTKREMEQVLGILSEIINKSTKK